MGGMLDWFVAARHQRCAALSSPVTGFGLAGGRAALYDAGLGRFDHAGYLAHAQIDQAHSGAVNGYRFGYRPRAGI